jgi:hypothetical protein
MLRSSFLVMESARNGYKNSDALLRPVVVSVVSFTSELFAIAREVYSLCGAEGGWLDQVWDAEPSWSGGKLLVSERHRDAAGLTDLLITLYMLVWAFRRWTTSSFLQYGAGGRQSRACGLLTVAG